MKFGGFSDKGIRSAKINALKEQYVFKNEWEINKPKNKFIFHFAGRKTELTRSSVVDEYIRFISNEKRVLTWKVLVGVETKRYELNQKELKKIIEESIKYINSLKSYVTIRWHDIVVLLMITQLYSKETELYKYSINILSNLNEKNTEFMNLANSFLHKS